MSDALSIERVEREGWLDLFAAAPVDYVEQSQVKFSRMGTTAALANQGVPIVEFNRSFCIGIEEPATEEDLDRTVEWMHECAGPEWALQISPVARPEAIHAWLEKRGMSKKGNGWAKFQRGSSPIRSQPVVTTLDVRLVDEREAESFGHVVQTAFGFPPSCAAWFSALVGRPLWKTYLAYDGDVPVASGALFIDGGWGWLGIDATLSDYRRRGAQTSLISRRVEDGLTAGVAGFTAETGQPAAGQEVLHTSYSNYRRAGFTPVYVRSNYRELA